MQLLICRAVEQNHQWCETVKLRHFTDPLSDQHKPISKPMEGPVLTESEVWKVGSGTSTSLDADDRNIDYSPLMNDAITDENLSKASENPGISIQEDICGSIQEEPDPEVTSDQIKSLTQQEQRLEEDLSSTQTAVESNEAVCKQERSVNQAEEPADKTCWAPGRQNLDQGINQEITILVTNHDCILEDEEDEEFGEQKTSSCPAEPETVSSVEGGGATEEESLDGSIVVVNMIEVSQVQKTSMSTEQNTTTEEPRLPGDSSNETNSGRNSSSTPQKTDTSSTHANTRGSVEVNVSSLKDQPTQPEDVEVKLKKTESTESRDAIRPAQEKLDVTRSPGRAQHVQTQVSLEVMYQSVATSPMTPPEGSGAFIFPSTFGKLANKCSTEVAQTIQTKDAELQVGLQVEFRSVATAPMSPIILTAPEVIPEPEPRIGVVTEEAPEPVQEVSWDEKGMTWEVYGAVVEVAVLGTAIQKHLEKRVKKLNKQPLTLPASADVQSVDLTETSTPMPSSPPPISDPGESSPAKEQSEENTVQSGRRRQNTFRRWFRNVRRPSCCSRPRQDEEN